MKKIMCLSIIFACIFFLLVKTNNAEGTHSSTVAEKTLFQGSLKPKISNNITSKKIDEKWMLMLVSNKNPLPVSFKPVLKSLSNGEQFDKRAIEHLNSMLLAAKKQGLAPIVCSGYRSLKKQQDLFNNQVKKQLSKGLNAKQAYNEAKKVVAYPGASEHNSGLAADIVSLKYQLLNEAQADTEEVKWLIRHCSEYGFILRYPEGKDDITGVSYEPWHFRYVGIDHAKAIMENDLCLEEYLSSK